MTPDKLEEKGAAASQQTDQATNTEASQLLLEEIQLQRKDSEEDEDRKQHNVSVCDEEDLVRSV